MVCSSPACPDHVACAGCRTPSAPASGLRRACREGLCAARTPWRSAAVLRVGGETSLRPCGAGPSRVSHVLDASLQACHALRTPTDPPASRHNRCCGVGCRCVHTVAVCCIALTRLSQTSGTCAFPCGLHGALGTLRMMRSVCLHLLHIRNTWYGWLARPSPAGTCTLQEAPSFAWRTNAGPQARLKAAARH